MTERIIAHIDGPLFRKQRSLLMRLADAAMDEDRELLFGLVNLTDDIADEAHDVHGIDCLFEESE